MGLCKAEGNFLKYLKRGWNRKDGWEKKDFKKRRGASWVKEWVS